MKPRIKLAFSDFWRNFDPRNNFLMRLLERRFEIELSDRPEFVIFSCFGHNYLRFNCTRILYSGENWRPDFRHCDYAFTFDHCNDLRHFRWPLYGCYGDPRALLKQPFDPAGVLAEKTRFCSFVYSNPLCRHRNRFFRLLSKYKPVDSGGRLFNNVGGPVASKLDFIRQSKFTISFENESHPGYTTEKLCDPMRMQSLPIYWGNPLVHLDFNPRSFINAHDWPSLETVVERVIEIDRNDELYLEHLRQPWYHGNCVNQYVDPEKVLAQFEHIFSAPSKPVALAPAARRLFLLDRFRGTPASVLRRIKRSTRKIAYRVSGV